MELVYLWVEDYKNIHKQGFNFSSKFICNYDEVNKELTIEDNPKHISNFFGENINVTAIVGKNGSGKSSLLKYFLDVDEYIPHDDEFYNDSVNKIENYISIFVLNNKLYYMSNIIDIKANIEQSAHIPFIRILSYLNYEELNDSPKDLMFNDIILNKSRIIAILNALYMSQYNFEFYPSHHFLYNNRFELSTFLYIPVQIEILPQKLEEVYNWKLGMYLMHASDQDRKELASHQKEIYNIAKDDYHRFLIATYLQKEDAKYNLDVLKDKKKLVAAYDRLDFEMYEKITEDDYKVYFSNRKIDFKEINDCEKFIYFGKKYNEFFDYDLIDNKYRKYNNLSTGEQTLFGVMLHIYYKLNLKYNYEKEDELLILCLDEVDVSLHPSWQKKCINEILNLCSKFDKKVHIIITTHFPFLLSDIPKQNIIFLDTYNEKDDEVKNEEQKNGNCKVVDGLKEKNQTFGANIHTLLSDSFFMEDGLMGEFAKKKINKIIDFFKNKNSIYENDKEKLLKIINTIGESFLKEKLFSMYNEKYPKTNEEKIAELKAEIQRLENG